ncbi:LysM peptidoglycan-binding domain-containing protein [Peredibacter sp. HCB2-198]|uniref:LysM peptidoglycan-binding domain-containing protein n=1 Tax=Peredibacter sp. HCB2-198 TaxID=3383025 RepID=UPI0038B6501F
MKKISVLSTLTLSSFLLMSCSQMKKTPSREMSSLMETVQIEDDEIFDKTAHNGEYTHEMAEADADDDSIKTTVGDAEIDKELPDSENNEVPYARNFLAKKNTKRMQFWVDYFTKQNRDRMQRFINNGEEYRHHIEAVFEQHGLPKELYFVGLIESGYYLGARSHASAVGPWQFIRGTGSRYGLKITSEIDERQDLFKATKAAAMYFKDLHNVFSSWELALSAYNAGEYGIIRRIMKHGTRDFYELSRNKQLPSETINYVPKVLAAMHVVNNAEKYGFVIPKKKHRLFDLTELRPVKKNISLHSVARRMNVDIALLKKLNPELRRASTPRYFAGTYFLRVPKSKYSYRLEDISAPVEVAKKVSKPESRRDLNRRTANVANEDKVETEVKPKLHRVRRGETLVSIARKYSMTPRELAQANDFKSWKTKVRIGQRLKLEGPDEQRVATRTVAQTPKVKATNKPIVYKVKRGDNLTDLARIFDLKVSKIKTANNLKRGQIQVGQKIVLPGTQKGIYTVRKGDHLTKVAREFNQPIEALVKINSLKRRSIYPGQKIIVNMD